MGVTAMALRVVLVAPTGNVVDWLTLRWRHRGTYA